MKTAISVPDDVYERVARAAALTGMNRSQFYTAGALKLAEEVERDRLVQEYDEALRLAGEDDTSETAVRSGKRTLAGSEW